MNELFEIYKRIEYLRNNGVKMKEIADHTQMAASVLSSLYSSVLPTFIGEVKKGIAEEEALDYALSQVNNVSKKRLLGNLEDMKERLFELEPPQGGEKRKSPFWDMMARESQVSAQEAYNYSGIYISYSLSSAADALKVEPYLITASENNEYVRVVHMSAYNTPIPAWGFSTITRVPTSCSTSVRVRNWLFLPSTCNSPCMTFPKC